MHNELENMQKRNDHCLMQGTVLTSSEGMTENMEVLQRKCQHIVNDLSCSTNE